MDAHTACLCICMHIYNSKSIQNKRYDYKVKQCNTNMSHEFSKDRFFMS